MPTIPGYGQQVPSEQAAIDALSALVGPAASEEIWSAAVRTAHLHRPVTRIGDLERVADELTRTDHDLARVGGRSLKIRLRGYQALARKIPA